MSYLVCETCNGYYELQNGESPDDFESCQCGGNLKHVEEVVFQEAPNYERKVIKKGKTFTSQKSFNYSLIMLLGGLITLMGFIGVYWHSYFSILVIVGFIVLKYGYDGGKRWIKGDIGEKITIRHLKKLPEEFIVFNDVNLPERYGNIDHVVVGPTGIFVIETKNYKGSYIVDGDDWYYVKNHRAEKTYSNPAGQVKRNSMALKRYLSIKGVNTYKLWINSVVALNNHSLKIVDEPKNYVILKPSELPFFIENKNSRIKQDTIVESIYIIEDCATEIV
ncbi:MAG: nuclease-related domain-containing protein [Methanobacterium sp.]